MDALIVVAAFAPLVLLIWVLVRYAGRIRHDAIDKDLRTWHLDNLNPAIARYVLERDTHTCRSCGTTKQVGVDFVSETPGEHEEITPDSLVARCTACYLKQWKTLQDSGNA